MRWQLLPILSPILSIAIIACALSGECRSQITNIDVATFNAHPDDGLDDTLGINNAIKAIGGGSVHLVFQPGVYDLYPPRDDGPTPFILNKTESESFFTIQNAADVTIEGNGATFLCHGYKITTDSKHFYGYFDLFQFKNCTGVTVQDLIVDMVRAPFTFGICSTVYAPPTSPPPGGVPYDQRYFEMLITGNQLHDGATSVTDLGNMHMDLFTHHTPLGVPNGRVFFHVDNRNPAHPHSFQVIQPVTTGPGSALHRIKGVSITSTPPYIGPGWNLMTSGLCQNNQSTFGALQAFDYVVAVHHFNQHVCFGFSNCDGIHVSDVTIHKFPGKAIWGFSSANLSVEGLNLIPSSDYPWPATLTGDGIWFDDCRGSASITDCHFEGLFDDGINIFTNYFPVDRVETIAQPKSFRIVIPKGHTRIPSWFRIGDVIQFCDKDMNELPAQPHATLSTNATIHQTKDELYLVFPGSKPSNLTAICNLSWFPQPQNYVISGCVFRTIRGSGIRLHANTSVESCTFQNVTNSAIACGPLWYKGTFTKGFCEGPSGGNLHIFNCDIHTTTYGWGFNNLNHGAISIQTSIQEKYPILTWDTGSYFASTNILVEECWFRDVGGAALTGRDARGIEVRSCHFGSIGIFGHLLGSTFHPAGQSLLYFNEAGNISIHDNTVLPGGGWTSSGPGVQKGTKMYGGYSEYSNVGF